MFDPNDHPSVLSQSYLSGRIDAQAAMINRVRASLFFATVTLGGGLCGLSIWALLHSC